MDQLLAIFNELVAFVKSDSFKAVINSVTAIAKSIDYGQIVDVMKKLIEVASSLAK